MASDDLTDADVLAELRLSDERERLWGTMLHSGLAQTWTDDAMREALRRIALSRREAREAAAVEREACARIVEREKKRLSDWPEPAVYRESVWRALTDMAAVIRARGWS